MNGRSDLPWFRFHVGDYLRATLGLPPLARLAFVELLAAQWDRGELPIESADVRPIVAGISAAEWARVWPHVDRLFPVVGTGRRNEDFERMRAEQARVRESRRNVAKKAAAERWRERVGVVPDA